MLPPIRRDSGAPIQSQLRRSIIDAIHAGQMQRRQKLLPSRQLAGQLGIARNTVTAVYEELVARGYLEARPRRGYFVAPDLPAADPAAAQTPAPTGGGSVDWSRALRQRPSQHRHLVKPANWQDFPYPFVYGQVDPALFPINIWRSCSRDALGRAAIDWWAADRANEDDPQLIEQIRTQILPRRGIFARPEEILITLGSQHGFYLISRLLVREGTRVGVEVPGYPDSRNIVEAEGAEIVELAVDSAGARLGGGALDLALLTPAHHCPTNVTMTSSRRLETLSLARQNGTILVEDDYEGETTFSGDGVTLKSLDEDGRVIYLGTLSKVLAPGVRLGFMVADAALIEEARWLRRLMHRSCPLNNQRTAAIFLAEGHYLQLIRNLQDALERRFERAAKGVTRHLPKLRLGPGVGSSLWLECAPGLDGRALLAAAARRGVLIESGDPFVAPRDAGRYLRMGVGYIGEDRIDAGLHELGAAIADLPGAYADIA
ncbi:aminotransferase-like domain-containing protein [Acidimangrovimonas sediminis]|uniref:aminotransferase-like domain-containing protein n=1 Tax=Acidimangrovimonas sediminis TaxID=2056283 RepID=UPI000C80F4B3|nr:PLP-dependent aminotransferase family protein [Acidimangrovimonas sediminis]